MVTHQLLEASSFVEEASLIGRSVSSLTPPTTADRLDKDENRYKEPEKINLISLPLAAQLHNHQLSDYLNFKFIIFSSPMGGKFTVHSARFAGRE